jgi:hypothetical protein
MKIKTAELTGAALDWAVAKCVGYRLDLAPEGSYTPSTDWAQGGPIIEREKIVLSPDIHHTRWSATLRGEAYIYWAQTPLIAAMRCYVASKLGDEVEIPEELV